MSVTQTADGSGQMFDRIAGRYDLLNRLMSFGMDRSWRRKLVQALDCGEGAQLLDVATGTADVALALANAYPTANVIGLDPSAGMLGVGRKKVLSKDMETRVGLLLGDAQKMPFASNSFHGSCISFGIRNVPDRFKGLSEMVRVTRSGGPVVVLELGEPREGFLSPLARFHVHHVVPRLGSWISGEAEYAYLQESVAAFPAPEEFATLCERAGMVDVSIRTVGFGAAHLYVGQAA